MELGSSGAEFSPFQGQSSALLKKDLETHWEKDGWQKGRVVEHSPTIQSGQPRVLPWRIRYRDGEVEWVQFSKDLATVRLFRGGTRAVRWLGQGAPPQPQPQPKAAASPPPPRPAAAAGAPSAVKIPEGSHTKAKAAPKPMAGDTSRKPAAVAAPAAAAPAAVSARTRSAPAPAANTHRKGVGKKGASISAGKGGGDGAASPAMLATPPAAATAAAAVAAGPVPPTAAMPAAGAGMSPEEATEALKAYEARTAKRQRDDGGRIAELEKRLKAEQQRADTAEGKLKVVTEQVARITGNV